MAGIANINGLQYLSSVTEVSVKGERWHDESSTFELQACNHSALTFLPFKVHWLQNVPFGLIFKNSKLCPWIVFTHFIRFL
jgi:hypothetical protein